MVSVFVGSIEFDQHNRWQRIFLSVYTEVCETLDIVTIAYGFGCNERFILFKVTQYRNFTLLALRTQNDSNKCTPTTS